MKNTWRLFHRGMFLYAYTRSTIGYSVQSIDMCDEHDYYLLPRSYARLLCKSLQIELHTVGINHHGDIVCFAYTNQSKKIH